MKITQTLLFALMAYQANAGLFGGDKTTQVSTSDTDVKTDGGNNGPVEGHQGDQQTGNGPVSGDSIGGSSGGTEAQSGSLQGAPIQIEADHTTDGGYKGSLSQAQTVGGCKGSCVTYQVAAPQTVSADTTDSSSTAYDGVGAVVGQTGNAESGDTKGGDSGNTAATGNAGSNVQTQDQKPKAGDVGNSQTHGGDADNTSSHEEDNGISLPVPIPVKRYQAGAYDARSLAGRSM